MISYVLFFGSLFIIIALFIFVKIQGKFRLKDIEREFERNPDGIFTVVEKNASPSGGFEAFYRFVAANMHYPLKAKDAGVEGRIYMSFIVEKDGSLSDIYAVKGIGFGCDEEAVRVIESYDNYWTPAQIKGENVRQKLVIPIIFKLDKKR